MVNMAEFVWMTGGEGISSTEMFEKEKGTWTASKITLPEALAFHAMVKIST
jgi:hypothetical protein